MRTGARVGIEMGIKTEIPTWMIGMEGLGRTGGTIETMGMKKRCSNSPPDMVTRNRRYDGQRICSSRECCRFTIGSSIFCRNKCKDREQNIRRNRVREDTEKIRRKRLFLHTLKTTTVVTDVTGEKREVKN